MATSARNGLVDYGRLVAALGIVWFHTQAPGNRVAYAALPFFLVLLAFPSSAGIGTKARRLLGPFIVFSAVFAAVNVAFALRRNEPLLGWWEWRMLLSGTSLHLWFLPFALLMSLAAPALRNRLAAAFAPVAVAALLAFAGTPSQIPFAQWAFGVVPVLIGFAWFAGGVRAAVPALLAASAVLFLFRPSPDNITILAGTGTALVTLWLYLPRSAQSDLAAGLSLWVYLTHPLVIIAGQTLGIGGIGLGLFALAGSLALAAAFMTGARTWRRTKPRGAR